MQASICQTPGEDLQKFILLKEKPPKGCRSSGRSDLKQIQATTRLDYLWPEIWIGMSNAAQKNEENEWAIEKPKIDNA